jgi:hypothetical protein
MIPSKNLAVVRLGVTVNEPAWDLEGFVSGVIAARPAVTSDGTAAS